MHLCAPGLLGCVFKGFLCECRAVSGSGGVYKHLEVVAAVLLADSVPAEGVVVEAGVLHQRYPLLPARGHIRAVVLVQILPKEG